MQQLARAYGIAEEPQAIELRRRMADESRHAPQADER
jgi:hypothetical protein